jgi:adenylate kinase family enzyme
MADLIVIAGAPGSGKTTVAGLLAKELNSFVLDFGILRQIHLNEDWSNQGNEEESMAFENLIFILRNYKKHGYKNIILTDLRDFRVQQMPQRLVDFNFMIATLYIKDEKELERRILSDRDSGYKNVEEALKWNNAIIQRKEVVNESKIENDAQDPISAVGRILELFNG